MLPALNSHPKTGLMAFEVGQTGRNPEAGKAFANAFRKSSSISRHAGSILGFLFVHNFKTRSRLASAWTLALSNSLLNFKAASLSSSLQPG